MSELISVQAPEKLAAPVAYQSSERPTVPEIPDMGDPFWEMLYVIHAVMPAILDVKQFDLAEMGQTMESLAIYQNKLSYAQDLLNEIFQQHGTREEVDQLGYALIKEMKDLRELVASEDVIDGGTPEQGQPYDPDSLKGQVLESLDRFINESENSDLAPTPGQYFYNLWIDSPQLNSNSGDARTELKKRLDDLNLTGIAFRSTSAQTQTLFDIDTQDYNAWVGLNDSMLKSMIEQVGAPIREGLKTG